MKLITHNILTSTVKGVTKGFPLLLQVVEKEIIESDFDPVFVQRMLCRLDWTAFLSAAAVIGLADTLPQSLPDDGSELLQDEDVLKRIHHALLEVDIIEGGLVCPESGRVFPITKGIPNMLLKNDEL